MEREVGPQVAGPLFVHQTIPARFFDPASMARKRSLPWANTTCHQSEHLPLNVVGYPGSSTNWNKKTWSWDGVNFVAKPVGEEECRLIVAEGLVEKDRGNESHELMGLRKNSEDEGVEDLTLKLGGEMYSGMDSRPNKRVRSGSPSGSCPMCQVDDCKADLSNAKDYHRRHKVCELHSKTAKALVGNLVQRFCQQCSRFHPLQEFDEGKRSCRRRLAGHNRRRRKGQLEDVSSHPSENGNGGNLDVVNVLTLFARLQGTNADKTSTGSFKDNLLQFFSKINSTTVPGNSGGRSPLPGNLDLNAKQFWGSLEREPKADRGLAAVSSNLLSILSSALVASSRGSQIPSNCSNVAGHKDQQSSPMTKLNFQDQAMGSELHKNTGMADASSGLEASKSFVSPDISEWPVRPSRPSVPLPLFISSPEEGSPSKMGSNRWYFSSDSSNLIEERSPSSSPAVQTLFPLHSSKEMTKQEKALNVGDNSSTEGACDRNKWRSPLNLFKDVNGRVENGAIPSLAHRGQDSNSQVMQAGCTSSSGLDHSPSSSTESLDQTGRISFKLFDKHPSNLPHTIRQQILDWLSNCPSEMESFIRPGCVVLTVYLSMPRLAWDKFHEDLQERVNALVAGTASDFWRSGRFLVNTDKQFASYKDGKIRVCKSWRAWNAPKLIYATPLAIQSGKETSIDLIGQNLRVTGTRIHCTYMGGYTSMEVPEDSSSAMDGEFSCVSFNFPGGASMLLGRCFIEVENGFNGNTFPVIIADSKICEELRSLEPELEQITRGSSVMLDGQVHDGVVSSHRKGIIHFLNELGWLFQRRSTRPDTTDLDFSSGRLGHLLAFAVERDWTTLVRVLLDIVMETNLEKEGVMQEVMGMLSEIQLLHRAVKRRCLKMVNFLLHYHPSRGSNYSMGYLFMPNSVGPGGITPLHLAACSRGSEGMVDALTNDPEEVGLSAWTSAVDASRYSPHGYALLKNHNSYIKLVQKKILEKTNGQISITVAETSPMEESWIIPDSERTSSQKSCTRCSIAAMKTPVKLPGGRGLLHRPYLHSMLAIAAVCVCVCILCRGRPQLGTVDPFKWENISYGWL